MSSYLALSYTARLLFTVCVRARVRARMCAGHGARVCRRGQSAGVLSVSTVWVLEIKLRPSDVGALAGPPFPFYSGTESHNVA